MIHIYSIGTRNGDAKTYRLARVQHSGYRVASMTRLPVTVLLIVFAFFPSCGPRTDDEFVDVVPHLSRVSDSLYSGGEPTDKSFEALSAMGVTTIISVDGARPDVVRAADHGLRYIHLPIGYAGIERSRAVELVKATQLSDGAVYIHCHYGLHRAPAAAAMVARANYRWSPKRATDFMTNAGTSPRYEGLYRSVEDFLPPDAFELDAVGDTFPSVAKRPPLVESMAEIDRTWDNLKLIEKAGFESPADHPDLSPAHEALQLEEAFTELARRSRKNQMDLARDLERVAAESRKLRLSLETTAEDDQHRAAIMKAIGKACSDCHKRARD